MKNKIGITAYGNKFFSEKRAYRICKLVFDVSELIEGCEIMDMSEFQSKDIKRYLLEKKDKGYVMLCEDTSLRRCRQYENEKLIILNQYKSACEEMKNLSVTLSEMGLETDFKELIVYESQLKGR